MKPNRNPAGSVKEFVATLAPMQLAWVPRTVKPRYLYQVAKRMQMRVVLWHANHPPALVAYVPQPPTHPDP
jgi:hypothetical protein